MKPILFYALLLCLAFLLAPLTAAAQTAVDEADSLALLSIYADLNPEARQSLQWNTANPVQSWDGVLLGAEGSGFVEGLDLSNRNIKGAFPNQIIQLNTLLFFSCANNQITSLPDLPTTLSEVYINNNNLTTLPFIDLIETFFQLIVLDCSSNELTFEDLSQFIDDEFIAGRVVYAPQKRLGDYTNHTYPGRELSLNLYPTDTPPLFNNEYVWEVDGELLAMTSTLQLTDLTLQDAGIYELQVTNPAFSNLTLEGSTNLIVREELLIDTSTLIIQAPEDDMERIDSIMNELGAQIDRECWCTDDEARLRLYQISDLERALIEINRLVVGSKSKIKTDTVEYNYRLVHNPTPSNEPPSSIGCIADQTGQPAANRVVLALIDSGSDPNHPAHLDGFATNPSPNTDGNCFAGDVAGWDFPNSTPIIIDYDGHGTHSMYIIRQNLPTGTSIDVMDLKVFHNGSGVLFDLICAIHYAVDMGVDVMNVSLGYYSPESSSILYTALERAQEAGIVVLLSAGNDGLNTSDLAGGFERWPGKFKYPGQLDTLYQPLDNIVIVGALSDTLENIASYSNYGPEVDLLAPGTNIRGALPGGEFGRLSGTSMSTSALSRAVAIALAKAPEKSYQDIIDCLKGSTMPIENDGGVAWGGKLDENVLAACLGIEDDIVVQDRPAPIRIFPNPFNEEVNVMLEDGSRVFQDVRFTITTMYDEVVYHETCSANLLKWNGRDNNGAVVPSGIYFLRIQVPDTRPYIVPVLRL